MSITQFMDHHFRHFNARETVDAARAWRRHLDEGGKMLLAMAGAMSTAELGISLAKMIRAGKVHAISCTAANFEEDIFNLVAHDEYRMVPHYRDLSPEAELALTVHPGPHSGDLDLAYGSLATYVTDHALAVDGPIREYYLVGQHHTPDTARWRTEIGWPVFRTSR